MLYNCEMISIQLNYIINIGERNIENTNPEAIGTDVLFKEGEDTFVVTLFICLFTFAAGTIACMAGGFLVQLRTYTLIRTCVLYRLYRLYTVVILTHPSTIVGFIPNCMYSVYLVINYRSQENGKRLTLG